MWDAKGTWRFQILGRTVFNILPLLLLLGGDGRKLSGSISCVVAFAPSSISVHRSGNKELRSSWPSSFSALRSGSNSDDNNNNDFDCDVVVLGSGPAGRAMATLLSRDGVRSVVLADGAYDRRWAANYGVWEDEWESIVERYRSFGASLDPSTCVDQRWTTTDCFFGGSFDLPIDHRLRIDDRVYLRINRDGLCGALSPADDDDDDNTVGAAATSHKNDGRRSSYRVIRASHCATASGVNLHGSTLTHDAKGSTVTLFHASDSEDKDQKTTSLRTRLVVDATGHETRLVLKDASVAGKTPPPPGYQIAYGIVAEVKDGYAGPYNVDAMTLFDYRTDHIPPEELEAAERSPTFMYVMPLGGNKVFFEETSLVARPALSFEVCKRRCYQRLKHLGIEVLDVEEEEFCYIPMGGPLPVRHQRVVAVGGANAVVHPSTGYNLCRTLASCADVAQVIEEGLSSLDAAADGKIGDVVNIDQLAAAAYNAVWSPTNQAQRAFAVFGGEFLMRQSVRGLRGFFQGFFALPTPYWAGFLAGWPGLPNNDKHQTSAARLWFGVLFLSKLPSEVAVNLVTAIVGTVLTDGGALLQSVLPDGGLLFGMPEPYTGEQPVLSEGDAAAKAEARSMIGSSTVTERPPVAFTDATGSSSTSSLPTTTAVDEDRLLRVT